jgi:hypothetical protein
MKKRLRVGLLWKSGKKNTSVIMGIKKRGQPLTLSSKLTHESTLLFYNTFYLLFVVVYQL